MANNWDRPTNEDKATKVGEVSKEFLRKVEIWTAFYRKFPFRFVEDALGIKLKLFQKILLYCLDNWMFSTILASRGLGKSFITAVYLMTRCILYPNTKVVIASGQISQACEILEYMNTIQLNSDVAHREIRRIITNKTDPRISFYNGSSVRVVASNDGSRGARANLLVLDEYRIVPKDILDLVLRKFKSDPRYCGWYDKPEYAEKIKKGIIKREQNKEIYLSSAWYRHHWSYKHFMSFFGLMTKGKNLDGRGIKNRTHFTCCLPYQQAIESGIKDIEALQAEYDEGVDEQLWDMEYCCKWLGTDDATSFFKFDQLDACRKIDKCLYSPEMMLMMDDKDKFFATQIKLPDEIRILYADIARKVSKSGENDATAIGIMSLFKEIDKRSGREIYRREVRYMETFTGQSTPLQAERLRKLYDWFDADYIVIDALNLGTSIIDILARPIIDLDTKEEYEPLNCINHDDLKLGEVLYPKAKAAVYGIQASAALNSEIAYTMRDTIKQRKIKLLCDETDAIKTIIQIKGFDTFSAEVKGKLREPYAQISALINEMIALQYKIMDNTNQVHLSEPSGYRKDRYSATSYANYYADILEKQNLITRTTYDDIDEFITFSLV